MPWVLIGLGCGSGDGGPPPTVSTALGPPGAIPPPEPTAAPVTRLTRSGSFVDFADETLTLCMDWRVEIHRAEGFSTEQQQEFAARRPKDPPENAVRVEGTCATEVGDRRPLVTCAFPLPEESTEVNSARLLINYYDFETGFGSDLEMRGCSQGGGRWNTISRDSDEFRDARRVQSRRRLEQAADRSQRWLREQGL